MATTMGRRNLSRNAITSRLAFGQAIEPQPEGQIIGQNNSRPLTCCSNTGGSGVQIACTRRIWLIPEGSADSSRPASSSYSL